MTWITLDEAKANLQTWLDAEKAVATGQSYKIGTRQLTRASLSMIAERIRFWRSEVSMLENGSRGIRVRRAVPIDL